jgi:hypothetical protein
VIREAKQQYYSKLSTSSDNKIKTTWHILKNETRKECISEQMP